MSVQQRDLFEDDQPIVYSVSQITQSLRRLVQQSFGELVIEGELSNTRQPASGHWYLTLKDEKAQLGAVFFRNDAASLGFTPEDGLRVRATGELDIYAPQGRYQLVIRRLEPVGQGSLELAFRQLCDRLRAEGLFEASRKKPLPRIPARIALVTSGTGAALHDMLTTLARRWPVAQVSVVAVAVQGQAAPGEIVQALQFLNRHQSVDVIIVGRGGGSLEDLWAFNDERVARAIVASRLPVVSGVGHEVDITIADLVADQRAATPTAAAALVVPDQREVRAWLHRTQQRLAVALRRQSRQQAERLQTLRQSYGLQRPQHLINDFRQRLVDAMDELRRSMQNGLELQRRTWKGLRVQLQALSPRSVLERGYTYCVDEETGELVALAADTRAPQPVRLHFADGSVPAQVVGPAHLTTSPRKGTA